MPIPFAVDVDKEKSTELPMLNLPSPVTSDKYPTFDEPDTDTSAYALAAKAVAIADAK
jgi:hypothetical protein